MRHIIFIDSLTKLNLKKDSSLMLATSFKDSGVEVYLLFEDDFYVANNGELSLKVYNFQSSYEVGSFYLHSFETKDFKYITLNNNDCIHMRIDPPFDTRYLRYLWMLRFYQEKGIRVINSPDGILKFNEKLHAYAQKSSLPSYVGSSLSEFKKFVHKLSPEREFILKPLDLFQGIGVQKINLDHQDIEEIFLKKVAENNGAIVVQPFNREVTKGEIRSIYFKGAELGSILKVPKPGEFLANIAQGATYHAVELNPSLKKECSEICLDLMKSKVDWVAFDIMGDSVSEINITCPGLLVEVSQAHNKNLANEIVKML
jgi:glutathione synthase